MIHINLFPHRKNNITTNDILRIRSELESIKSFIFEQTRKSSMVSQHISNKTRFTNISDEDEEGTIIDPDTDPDNDTNINTNIIDDDELKREQDDDDDREYSSKPIRHASISTMHLSHVTSIKSMTDIDIEKDVSYNNDHEKEVRTWLLTNVAMPQYIDNFISNGFDDLSVIKEMTINELDIIGIKKLGHKMKLLQHIRKLWGVDEILPLNLLPLKQSSRSPTIKKQRANINRSWNNDKMSMHMIGANGTNHKIKVKRKHHHNKRNFSVSVNSMKKNGKLNDFPLQRSIIHNKVYSEAAALNEGPSPSKNINV